ncbi:hypothetical protein EVC27_096 [Rhizobium phage RHph_I1_6]|uniref:Uncharacterized protein n=1 Tax=Rhizobium phage RHph_I1_6 TaxID=2509728 RepID=A0A7S5RFK0_9CAUD|nr:hypothetical protein PP745_gp095 [Rhizobium phage RHph_I1_6]QIG76618.1 hypothetical protein EVC27_096 [Rhizobium phage RHph_I1_6]
MRGKHKVGPNEHDIIRARRCLRDIVYFGNGPSTRMSEDDAIILDRYIEFLEEQLGAFIEQYHGVPTEYFNMVKRERLEWRPLGPTPRLFDL